MRLGLKVIIRISVLMLSGCGAMLPGTIYSQDGKVMPFAIEKAYRTGKVTASDPETGEQFTGTYTGILERFSRFESMTINTNLISGSGYGMASMGSNIGNATAYLKGDKGTMLNCVMKIETAPIIATPHGLGGCDDNHGKPYRLQF